MLKRIMLLTIALFFCLMLVGCSWFSNSNTTINTHHFYQTDYNYFCFDGDKTWSQIVICLDTENKAEKAQNKVTNDLLDKA